MVVVVDRIEAVPSPRPHPVISCPTAEAGTMGTKLGRVGTYAPSLSNGLNMDLMAAGVIRVQGGNLMIGRDVMDVGASRAIVRSAGMLFLVWVGVAGVGLVEDRGIGGSGCVIVVVAATVAGVVGRLVVYLQIVYPASAGQENCTVKT